MTKCLLQLRNRHKLKQPATCTSFAPRSLACFATVSGSCSVEGMWSVKEQDSDDSAGSGSAFLSM